MKRDAVTEVGPCFECCKNVVAKGKERWLKEFQNYPEVNIPDSYLSRKIAFYGVRAEILLTRNQGSLESRVGSVKKY